MKRLGRYKRYGQPNDLLIRLNVFDFKVTDVHTRPVYNIGERSGMFIPTVIMSIAFLLVRMFLWRLKEKYVIRDFHPLVFFYLMSFALGGVCAAFVVRLVVLWARNGQIPEITLLIVMFAGTFSFLALFFAMWFDMERNKDLK